MTQESREVLRIKARISDAAVHELQNEETGNSPSTHRVALSPEKVQSALDELNVKLESVDSDDISAISLLKAEIDSSGLPFENREELEQWITNLLNNAQERLVRIFEDMVATMPQNVREADAVIRDIEHTDIETETQRNLLKVAHLNRLKALVQDAQSVEERDLAREAINETDATLVTQEEKNPLLLQLATQDAEEQIVACETITDLNDLKKETQEQGVDIGHALKQKKNTMIVNGVKFLLVTLVALFATSQLPSTLRIQLYHHTDFSYEQFVAVPGAPDSIAVVNPTVLYIGKSMPSTFYLYLVIVGLCVWSLKVGYLTTRYDLAWHQRMSWNWVWRKNAWTKVAIFVGAYCIYVLYAWYIVKTLDPGGA